MDRVSIRKKLIDLIEDQGLDSLPITDEMEFIKDIGFDSLDVVEFIMVIEDEFDMSISNEDAEQVATIKDALDYLEPLVKAD